MKKTTYRGTLPSVLLTKCYSVVQIKKMRWAGRVARMGDRTGGYRVLVEGPVGKRPH